MPIRWLVIAFVALTASSLVGCQSSSVASPPPSPPLSGEILYILNGGTVTTYVINAKTLEPSPVSGPVVLIPAPSFLLQLVPAPNGHSLYVLWVDGQQQEHLSAFATDTSGVPQTPASQMLNVSSLSQLNIHPSGKFGYAMQQDQSESGYVSRVLLFPINASGMLHPTGIVQGTYGPSIFLTSLYGISPNGTKIYFSSEDGTVAQYLERTVNKPGGRLAANTPFFSSPAGDSVVLGATLIVDYQSAFNYSEPQYVDVLSNEPGPPQLLIHCTTTMLHSCAASTNVELDPSGKFLFMTDPSLHQVRVASIDLSSNQVSDTGSFLPFTAETPGFAFSPDGILVYALLARDSSIHVYRFDSRTGNLTEGPTPIPITGSGGFTPALRS
jgi:DNA-binding beta-propeller fold protein YncE